jgi:hypothetical protein
VERIYLNACESHGFHVRWLSCSLAQEARAHCPLAAGRPHQGQKVRHTRERRERTTLRSASTFRQSRCALCAPSSVAPAPVLFSVGCGCVAGWLAGKNRRDGSSSRRSRSRSREHGTREERRGENKRIGEMRAIFLSSMLRSTVRQPEPAVLQPPLSRSRNGTTRSKACADGDDNRSALGIGRRRGWRDADAMPRGWRRPRCILGQQ